MARTYSTEAGGNSRNANSCCVSPVNFIRPIFTRLPLFDLSQPLASRSLEMATARGRERSSIYYSRGLSLPRPEAPGIAEAERRSMFTIKLYQDAGRQKILAADSFTILRGGPNPSEAEITLHQKNGESIRYDIMPPQADNYEGPTVFQRAIIENMAGKTTEIIQLRPLS